MTNETRRALVVLGILSSIAIAVVAFGPKINVRPSESPFSVSSDITPEERFIGSTDMNETSMPLPVYDFTLPAFQGITQWWNLPAGQASLTPESLLGKVVFVDFWTYSCINCVRTFPFLREMHQKYADHGLVIVGVHTPEFAFEAEPKNVERAIRQNELRHPIALDPQYLTWRAYNNKYWPAGYYFDHLGRLRYTHFGEGSYQENEEVIRKLLIEAGATLDKMAVTTVVTPNFEKIKTPETYFGLSRGTQFSRVVAPQGVDMSYELSPNVQPNKWDVAGTWMFKDEYVQSRSTNARFLMNVQASKMHLVMESEDGSPKTVEIFVDGVKINEVTVTTSDLYTVAEFPDASRHTVELRIQDAGVRFFAATFS